MATPQQTVSTTASQAGLSPNLGLVNDPQGTLASQLAAMGVNTNALAAQLNQGFEGQINQFLPQIANGMGARAGILGQTLFLALTAKPEDSSPTARGLFVREQFLCQHVPDPPPGVNMNLPPVTEAKPK